MDLHPNSPPPKEVWCYWDCLMEFMDVTDDPEEAARWATGPEPNVFRYELKERWNGQV